jgi:zinc-ribbon domain
MPVKVGKPIDVGEVLSKSTSLLTGTPALMIPQLIVLALSLLEDLANASTQSGLGVILAFISAVVSIIIAGAYPSMVQAALGGAPLSIEHSLRQAASRFWTLFAAGILVGLIVVLGLIALIIPGIIFVTWYAYTVPAIMLENKGALEGMSASKAFGRDKKWSTFVLGLVGFVVVIVVLGIQAALSMASPLLGHVVYSLLYVLLGAWISVIVTYTYLTYGPSSVPAAPVSEFGGVPPAMMNRQQVPQADSPAAPSPPASFCKSCGSRIEPGSKFCANCGQPV